LLSRARRRAAAARPVGPRAGIALGSIAVLFRCVQVYVAHLALCFPLALHVAACVLGCG